MAGGWGAKEVRTGFLGAGVLRAGFLGTGGYVLGVGGYWGGGWDLGFAPPPQLRRQKMLEGGGWVLSKKTLV